MLKQRTWTVPLLVFLLLAFFFACERVYVWVYQPFLFQQAKQRYDLKPGTPLRRVAFDLHEMGIVKHPWAFIVWARLKGEGRALQAGEYFIPREMNTAQLLEQFVQGNVIQYAFTIVPGWTFNQLYTQIEKNEVLGHRLKGDTPAEIKKLLGFSQSLEGQFFPETYRFTKGETDFEILVRAHRLMEKVLNEQWPQRDAGLPLKNKQQALIMASLVEREGHYDQERGLIAAVFYNRLEKRMPLQTDPTVIYALGSRYQGKLSRRDLKVKSPYNTYLHRGLPPTPIAIPGLASILATLHPEESQALYFVARGDGYHVFSLTLKEHNRAVRAYRRYLRSAAG